MGKPLIQSVLAIQFALLLLLNPLALLAQDDPQSSDLPPVPRKPSTTENVTGLLDELDLEDLLKLERQTLAVAQAVPRAVINFNGGCGVLISPDGWFLTAAHVAEAPGRVYQAKLANGVEWPARIVGVRKQSDTAIGKLLNRKGWPYVRVAESDELTPGQWCLTVGFPMGFRRDLPAALRIGRMRSKSSNRLTTDVPMMGGDSGGPLFDMQGRLIAINSRITRKIDENFHVPIAQFRSDWTQLSNGQSVPFPETARLTLETGGGQRP